MKICLRIDIEIDEVGMDACCDANRVLTSDFEPPTTVEGFILLREAIAAWESEGLIVSAQGVEVPDRTEALP